MVFLDHVSEGQLNERLMNAAGSDEPITRTRSSTRRFIINMMMRMEIRSTTGVFVVQDNKTINNSNVSMRLFGSTGEPDGRGDRIWDGGLGEPQWLRARAAIAYDYSNRRGPGIENSKERSARQAGGKSSGQSGSGKESKSMDINEPSLMDVAHDTINSTQGPALIEAVVEAKPIATPTIKYEIWPLLKDLMEWPSPPKSAYVVWELMAGNNPYVECRYHEREVQDTRPINPKNHPPMCRSLAHPGPRRPAQLKRPSLI
ncbi:hypothetical protein ACFE04_019747 [Oxalis oulophora]